MVICADKSRTDGVAFEFLQQVPTDIPILLISRSEHLDFNESVLGLAGKPFIVADYIENGWEWNQAETFIVGQNTDHFGDVCVSGWGRLDEFLAQNKPLKYFKRELLKKDRTEWLCPIEYPNRQNPYPIQTEAEFNARPIDVFNFWGRSHEARVQLHGDIWKGASKYGYSVCDNIYFFNDFMANEQGRKWVSLWMPHYRRVGIQHILAINGMSKLSMSLPGAGIKCFRSTGEAIVNSVMVCKEDDLAWSYPFVHFENCIKFWEFGDEISAIEKALQSSSLYDVYCEGLKAADWYRADNYINNYLLPLINKA